MAGSTLGEIGISIKGTEQILTAGFGSTMFAAEMEARLGCQGTSGRDCAGHPETMGPKNRPVGAEGCWANRPLDIASPISRT